MTSRQTVAVSALVAVALTVALGIAVRIYQDGAWWQRLRDAQTAITANQTALNSAGATGQPVQQLLGQCDDAVADYDQAARHLDLPTQDPDQECQP